MSHFYWSYDGWCPSLKMHIFWMNRLQKVPMTNPTFSSRIVTIALLALECPLGRASNLRHPYSSRSSGPCELRLLCWPDPLVEPSWLFISSLLALIWDSTNWSYHSTLTLAKFSRPEFFHVQFTLYSQSFDLSAQTVRPLVTPVTKNAFWCNLDHCIVSLLLKFLLILILILIIFTFVASFV